MTAKKVIYDFGANNGDNIEYYLKKCDILVAVEANPILCEIIESRFGDEISNGCLVVENCVLTDDSNSGDVFFYRHKTNHVLSQYPAPVNIDKFEKIVLPSKSVIDIIRKYGDPYYIKIDIEHYDEKILESLFSHGIMPEFISAESHTINIFCLLVGLGNYRAFKLVDGPTVSKVYSKHTIVTIDNHTVVHSFPHHSAGPFGDDIQGEWLTSDRLFSKLSSEGLGWKDIHASNSRIANDSSLLKVSKNYKYSISSKYMKYFYSLLLKTKRLLLR